MQDNKNKVLFRLRDDALIVANTGTPFTRRGVISVCYAHLSEKGQTPPEDTYECSDENLVGEIRKKAMAVYRMDKNRLQMDAAEESAINKDYSGRVLWGLLQNADDAAKGAEDNASHLIGEKGLGFKSVLEITREPEIYSGPFHFRFSSKETERVLKQEGLAPHQLTLHVPHLSEPSEECIELLEDYDTVIRLPFYSNEAKEEIAKELGEISARCLLLCRQIDVIEVAIDGKVNILEIDRKAAKFATGTSDLTITTRDNTDSPKKEKWRRWLWVQRKSRGEKRQSVAVCLPFRADEIVACETALPLHVFFPTSERIGARALIHASFDLQMNRGHLAKKQRNEDALIEAIERIVEQVLVNIPPASALDVFEDIIAEKDLWYSMQQGRAGQQYLALDAMSQRGEVDAYGREVDTYGRILDEIIAADNSVENGLIQKIKKSIVKTMNETKFVPVVGGHKTGPGNVCRWEHNLGNVVRDDSDDVKEYALLIPELNEDSRRSEILDKLGAEHCFLAFQAAELLAESCRNDSLEDCWRAFEAADSMMKSELSSCYNPEREMTAAELRQAPIWFTEKGYARALDDGSGKPLLLEKPDDWPAWLPVDSLASEFGKRLKKFLHEREKDKSLTDDFSIHDDFRVSEYQIGKWPLNGDKQLLIEVLSREYLSQENSDWCAAQHFKVLLLLCDKSGR